MAEAVVGWVAGEAVEAVALDAYLMALGGSAVGTRVGVDELAIGQPAQVGEVPGDAGVVGPFSKQSALRTWAAKGLLADRLLEREAARLGVTDPSSLDQWVSALEGAGEISVGPPGFADALACYQASLHRYRAGEARRVRHLLVAERAAAEILAAEVAGAGGGEAAAQAGGGQGAAQAGGGQGAAQAGGGQGAAQAGEGTAAAQAGGRATTVLGDLASRCSLDEGSRRRRGDLGWVERGQLAGALEEVIFAATPGELRGPVESPFGWHLLVVEAVRQANLRPFEECREEILVELAADRRREAVRQWWGRRLAEAVRVPAGSEHPVHPGLPGSLHRH